MKLCECGCGEPVKTSRRRFATKRCAAVTVRRRKVPVEQRFWAKVDKRGADECWLWTGTIQPNGYGCFGVSAGKSARPHRFVYELLVGPIPPGYQIDHVKARGCTSRACVNPAHLEPVTGLENTRRGYWTQRTHCVNGHEFTPENTKMEGSWRRCLTCRRERDLRRRPAKEKRPLSASSPD